jgi:hypothetical protein
MNATKELFQKRRDAVGLSMPIIGYMLIIGPIGLVIYATLALALPPHTRLDFDLLQAGRWLRRGL